MNMFLSRFHQFAKTIGENRFLKIVLTPFWYPIRKFIDKNNRSKNLKRKQVFKEKGFSIFVDFVNTLSNNNIPYTVAFGTLLGAVREHGFIKHDFDIDIIMWFDDYSPRIPQLLKESGFDLKIAYSVDEKRTGYEETYEKEGVSVDVFYLYESEEGPYCCDFLVFPDCVDRSNSISKHGGLLPRKLLLPYTKDIIKTKFESIEVNVPQNYHQILAHRYGDDYMIPNPQWSIRGFDEHIIELTDKVGIVKVF